MHCDLHTCDVLITRNTLIGLRDLGLRIHRMCPDSDLPTAHTCFNTLLLPEYATKRRIDSPSPFENARDSDSNDLTYNFISFQHFSISANSNKKYV